MVNELKMKRIVTFGEIMMRLTVPGFGKFAQANSYQTVFGGSEANVSASLAQFGFSTAHITAFPDNDLGKAANNHMISLGVDMRYTKFRAGRLGLYFMENGAMFRSPKIIYDRFHSAFSQLKPGDFNWDEIMQGTDWFHWTGITPAISHSAAEACLQAIKAAKKAGAMVSGDINYRRNLWQYGKSALEVMPELIANCDLIVAGTEDVKNCLGIDEQDLQKCFSKVQNKYPTIKTIATTHRETLSANHNTLQGVICSADEMHLSPKHDLNQIVDRVGTGDAFMAGLVYAKLQGKDDQHIIDFATAAGAYKHAIEGDVNIATVEDIAQLLNGENLGKLLR